MFYFFFCICVLFYNKKVLVGFCFLLFVCFWFLYFLDFEILISFDYVTFCKVGNIIKGRQSCLLGVQRDLNVQQDSIIILYANMEVMNSK